VQLVKIQNNISILRSFQLFVFVATIPLPISLSLPVFYFWYDGEEVDDTVTKRSFGGIYSREGKFSTNFTTAIAKKKKKRG